MTRNTHLLIVLCVLSSLFSCKNSSDLLGTDDGNYALIIKYDKQEIAYQDNSQVSDTSNLILGDKLLEMPSVSREFWTLKIQKDGTTKMEVEMLEPTISFGEHPSLQKDVNQEIKKVIYENERAYFFDKNNKLLYDFESEVPNMKELIEFYKKSDKTYSYDQKSNLKADIDYSKNIEIEETEFVDETMGNLKERTFVDTLRNILLKSELYKNTGELISIDSLEYEEFADGHFLPTFEIHTSFLENINGEKYTHITRTSYLSIDIINNL